MQRDTKGRFIKSQTQWYETPALPQYDLSEEEPLQDKLVSYTEKAALASLRELRATFNRLYKVWIIGTIIAVLSEFVISFVLLK